MKLVLILLLSLDVQFSLLIKRVGLLLLPEDLGMHLAPWLRAFWDWYQYSCCS